MSDKSWEDCVNAVCVQGRPGKLEGLAQDWEALFSNARSVSQSLRDGIRNLKAHWKGPAADDYFGKLESIVTMVEGIEQHNGDIVHLLRKSKDALALAQTTMPVPDYMLDEVQGRQKELDAANDAGARAMVGGGLDVATFGLSIPASLLLPDSFMKPLADSFIGNWGREAFGHFTAWWDDWDGSMTNQARDILNTADRSYTEGAAITAPPTGAHGGTDVNQTPLNFGNTPGGPGASPYGGLHPGTSSFNPHTISPDTPTPGPGFDPLNPPPPGTGLSGAEGGGLTGAGGASGFGAGAGGLGGGGLTGAGAGGVAGGAVAAGRPVSAPMMPPMGGMGGMAGGGRAAARASRATAGRGGMVGPHGAGMGGDEDDRSSWLTEDEDVWGSGDGAAPGVLR
jgi:uncharacterized protein YukE